MKQSLGRFIMALAMAVGFGLIVPAMIATPAYAATCSGYGCDYKDPIATGCNAGSYTVTSASITYQGVNYGTVELRWSPTCQTNWARTTVGSSYLGKERWASVYRQTPYATAQWHYTGPGNPIYGNMLYAPGCAEAEGNVWISSGNIATGWAVQPGCPQF
jgi:hypothetical protein